MFVSSIKPVCAMIAAGTKLVGFQTKRWRNRRRKPFEELVFELHFTHCLDLFQVVLQGE